MKFMKNKNLVAGLILHLLALLIFPLSGKAQINEVIYLDTRNINTKESVDISLLEHRVFERINQKRAEFGLEMLVWNEQVAAVSRLHSANMAKYDFFSHVGIDGKQIDGRADSLGLSKWRMIGENIAYNMGFDDPIERAISGWMQSPGHRKNLLRNNWKETGIGISVSAKGKYFITQVFLQRK